MGGGGLEADRRGVTGGKVAYCSERGITWRKRDRTEMLRERIEKKASKRGESPRVHADENTEKLTLGTRQTGENKGFWGRK